MPAYRVDPEPATKADLRLTRSMVDTLARGQTRRAALRLLAAGVVAAPIVVRSHTAHAIKGWCRRDPIVQIGEMTVQIVLFSDTEMHELATGPTQLVITVPPGMATRHVADDPGFGHFGYDTCFTESHDLIADDHAIDVQVEAFAPATNPAEGPLPLLLQFTRRGSGIPAVAQAEGRANEWVRLRAKLAARDFDEPDDIPPVVPPLPPADPSSDTPPADVPHKKDKKGRGKKKSR